MLIYLIRNKSNDKVYIGKTVQKLNKRLNSHLSDARGRKRMQISQAIAKYGWDNFEVEVLEETDEVGLDMAERFWIGCYDCMSPKGYNVESGGSRGKQQSPETRARKRVSQLKRPPMTDETRLKLSESASRRTLPQETRQKISETLSGRAKSEKARANIAEANRRSPRPQKLTWNEVREMRNLRLQGETIPSLAARFGIHMRTVGSIVRNKAWIENEFRYRT